MANVYDFSSDNVNVFLMVIDSSGSMDRSERQVREGLKRYKEEFEDFYGADSIAVAVSTFSDSYYEGKFKKVRDLDTNYSTGGATALYYSIVKASNQLIEYVKEVTKRTNVFPRSTLIFWSDGEPCEDPGNPKKAKEAIAKLNELGCTTVFIACGKAITSRFGDKIGFQSTIDVVDRSSIAEFIGEELSRSSMEQSKSVKALGSNFFSKAKGNNSSSAYSNKTEQALEDDDWFDQI